MLLERYREFLSITDRTPLLTLNEGDTPLIAAPRLAASLGVRELFLKYEGLNPTGSFKDRGMVMAVAKALEAGASSIICASTGNTSASAAAYAARAGIEAIVVVPAGKIALGKLAQALMYGARLLVIEGNFDQALNTVRDLADKYPVTLVNSVNPHRLEGQTTAAYEICDTLGGAPDGLCLPVGNAGNISAYWMGFCRYYQAGKIDSRPRMLGFQAAGSAPIVLGHPVDEPETVATAIRIGNPASWRQAEEARDDSGGLIDSVTDEQILDAHRILSSTEGIFVEPGSAASIAGLLKMADAGRVPAGATIVCTVTGHGLKDPQWALRTADGHEVQPVRVGVDVVSVATALGLE